MMSLPDRSVAESSAPASPLDTPQADAGEGAALRPGGGSVSAAKMPAKRPRRWRWLVVQHDLPPLPKHAEVAWGYLTKRAAEHEAQMLRYSHTPPLGGPWMVRIDVVRGGGRG